MSEKNKEDVLHAPRRLFPPVDDCVELTVTCPATDYSASRIAHAIEDCDAHLINLNVTSPSDPASPLVEVLLRLAMRNPESAVRALERYGYNTIAVHTPGTDDSDTFKERVSQLLTHLDL